MEAISDLAQKLYAENLQKPIQRRTQAIDTLNQATKKLQQHYFKDVHPSVLNKIENYIMSGQKREGDPLWSKARLRFQEWEKQTLENIQNPKAIEQVKRPQLGHLTTDLG